MTDFNLTEETLTKAYQVANTEAIPYIVKYAAKYNINTKKRLAAFLACGLVDSFGFRNLKEKFDYKSGITLYEEYRQNGITLELANKLVKEGLKAVISYLFYNKFGNTSEEEAVKYQPRGIIRLFGKDTYETVSKITGIDFVNNPEELETLENAVQASMAYWDAKGYNEMADNLKVMFDGSTLLKTRENGTVRTDNFSDCESLVLLRNKINTKSPFITDTGIFFESLMKNL